MNPTIPFPRPVKRTRLDDQVHEVSFSNPRSSPSSPRPNSSQVKSERSLSPPGKRLVTSGVKRFAPLPTDCLPSYPQYKRNRQEWVGRCVKELEASNLKAERKLIRDDGLIIDWTSNVPVWSDTLRQETLDLASTIALAHQTNAQRPRPRVRRDSPSKSQPITAAATPEPPTSNTANTSPTKRKLPVPPRSSSMRRAAASQLVSSSSSSPGPPTSPSPQSSFQIPSYSSEMVTIEGQSPPHLPSYNQMTGLLMSTPETRSESAPQGGQEYKPSPTSDLLPVVPTNISNQVRDQSNFQCESSAAEEEMSEMTENYLRRYVQTYEADRASLASAYSRNASFAYRVHKIVHAPGAGMPTIPQTSPKASTSGPKRTRLEITMTLLTLSPLHSIHSSIPVSAQINYDIFYLGAEGGMFVICRGLFRDKTVVHNFVLQRKEADGEEAAVEGVWPLVATAHQILVFEF